MRLRKNVKPMNTAMVEVVRSGHAPVRCLFGDMRFYGPNRTQWRLAEFLAVKGCKGLRVKVGRWGGVGEGRGVSCNHIDANLI